MILNPHRRSTVFRFLEGASYNFAYFDHVPDLDWDKPTGIYPEGSGNQSTFEYYRVLQHFLRTSKRRAHECDHAEGSVEQIAGSSQVAVSDVQRKPIVTNVAKGLSDRIPIGSEITEVEGMSAVAYLKKNVLPYISSSTEHIL